jgi:hypothetical protein
MNIFSRQALIFLLALLPPMSVADTVPATGEVIPVASFSSIRQDAEHCNGHRLDVWHAQASYLGLFAICEGTTGDIVTAVANISQFDSTSGSVVFETRLSRGMDYLKGGVESPSKDHFTFTGHWAGDEITGTLTWTDDNYPTHKPRTSTVHWHRALTALPKFNSESAWRRHADELTGRAAPVLQQRP